MLYRHTEIFSSPYEKTPLPIRQGRRLVILFQAVLLAIEICRGFYFSPRFGANTKKAHHLFTGGALDFSYLGKCFILRLRQNYLRGLLMAA